MNKEMICYLYCSPNIDYSLIFSFLVDRFSDALFLNLLGGIENTHWLRDSSHTDPESQEAKTIILQYQRHSLYPRPYLCF